MKKFLSSLLSLSLVLSLFSSSVLAADISTSGSSGDVPVELTQSASTFSVTVPTVLPVDVSADGTVTVATNNSIVNNSYGPVEVKGAEVISKNGWTLVDFAKDFGKSKVGLKEFGFQLNGEDVAIDGSVGISNFNVIPGNSSELFTYAANIAVQKSALSNEEIAQVVFTLGWSLIFNIANPPAPEGTYLTFSSPSSFTLKTGNGAKNWDGTLEYSTDTSTWKTWDGTTELSSVDNDGEYAIYLRGTGNTVITGNSSNRADYRWIFTGSKISCIGNIETLLDYAIVELGEHPAMASYCYSFMFYGCDALTTAPALPATTLTEYCYANMLSRCTSLTTAPALPATTLATCCYANMFYNCTALTTVPALPATTLDIQCYYGMFQSCTSLKVSATQTGEYTQAYRVPTSGDGTTASTALYMMFKNTGGTFTDTPSINTTYYLHSSNSIVE